MQETKKPYQSKTILINAALGLISVAAMFVPSAAGLADFIKSHSVEIGLGFSFHDSDQHSIQKLNAIPWLQKTL